MPEITGSIVAASERWVGITISGGVSTGNGQFVLGLAPVVTGQTFDIKIAPVESGTFTVDVVTWTGVAVGIPTIKVNGTTVTLTGGTGTTAGGTTVTWDTVNLRLRVSR